MAVSNVGKSSIGSKKSAKGGFQGGLLGKSSKAHTSNSAQNVGFKDELARRQVALDNGEGVSVLLANGEIDNDLLTSLQDNIHMLGDMLISKPGYNTVVEYKKAVQSLLKSIVPHLHEKRTFIAPKKINGEMRQRKFTLIRQVNEKLDTVLKLVLSSQDDQMRLMRELDEIKGLIVDILR